MTTTADVLEDSPQAEGRYLTIEWTSTGGRSLRNRRRVPAGTDATAFATSLIPQVEATWKQEERDNALILAYSGDDLSTFTPEFNTVDEVNQFVTRNATNLLRDGRYEDTPEAINCVPFLDRFSNSQLLAYLEGANTGQVNGWRNFVEGLRTTLTTYVPGIPEQTP